MFYWEFKIKYEVKEIYFFAGVKLILRNKDLEQFLPHIFPAPVPDYQKAFLQREKNLR